MDDVDQQVRSLGLLIFGGMAVSLVILAWIVARLVRTMVRPLQQLVDSLEGSDLTQRIQLDNEAEIGRAANAFNVTMHCRIVELQDLVHRVASGSTQLAGGRRK